MRMQPGKRSEREPGSLGMTCWLVPRTMVQKRLCLFSVGQLSPAGHYCSCLALARLDERAPPEIKQKSERQIITQQKHLQPMVACSGIIQQFGVFRIHDSNEHGTQRAKM